MYDTFVEEVNEVKELEAASQSGVGASSEANATPTSLTTQPCIFLISAR